MTAEHQPDPKIVELRKKGEQLVQEGRALKTRIVMIDGGPHLQAKFENRNGQTMWGDVTETERKQESQE